MSELISTQLLRRLESQLLAKRSDLIQLIHEELLEAGDQCHVDLANQVHDRGDESVYQLLMESELALLERHREALSAVEEALLRIKDGSYGACDECGCLIKQGRLLANPTALRCLECQEINEERTNRN